MSDQHLKRYPHNVRGKTAWWYEESDGICVVAPCADRGQRQITIPWRLIRAALERKDRR